MRWTVGRFRDAFSIGDFPRDRFLNFHRISLILVSTRAPLHPSFVLGLNNSEILCEWKIHEIPQFLSRSNGTRDKFNAYLRNLFVSFRHEPCKSNWCIERRYRRGDVSWIELELHVARGSRSPTGITPSSYLCIFFAHCTCCWIADIVHWRPFFSL